MKTHQKFNFKCILTLSLCLLMSMYAESQEIIKMINSPVKEVVKSIELEKSNSVVFPIQSRKTTDVNYEKNIQKSKETQADFNRQPVVFVKNNQYYTRRVLELKRRIQEIEDNPDSPSVNSNKLEGLKSKLKITEQEYIEFKKSK